MTPGFGETDPLKGAPLCAADPVWGWAAPLGVEVGPAELVMLEGMGVLGGDCELLLEEEVLDWADDELAVEVLDEGGGAVSVSFGWVADCDCAGAATGGATVVVAF